LGFWGKWGFDKVLPTNENGKKVLNPKKIDSAIVGLGLLVFGMYYLIKTKLIFVDIALWILRLFRLACCNNLYGKGHW